MSRLNYYIDMLRMTRSKEECRFCKLYKSFIGQMKEDYGKCAESKIDELVDYSKELDMDCFQCPPCSVFADYEPEDGCSSGSCGGSCG